MPPSAGLTHWRIYQCRRRNTNRREMALSKESSLVFGHQTRFVVLVLVTVCLTILMSNSLAFSFTVICMDDVAINSTDHWLHSPAHRNALFSVVAVGSICGTLPLMHLLQYFGMRKTLFFYGMSSGLSTLLFPFAVELGFFAVVVARIVQGLALGMLFSATGAIATTWAPLRETGTYIAMLSAHVQLASIFTMPVGGFLCETQNWRLLYYGQGAFTLLLFFFFFWFFENHPSKHRNVSSKELSQISENRLTLKGKQPVPYLAVMAHPSIIGCLLSSTGSCFGFVMLLYYGPTYINKALGLDLRSTGFATALPYILAAGVKFAAGPLYDKATFLSEKCRFLLFASLSQGMMIICFLVISTTGNATMAQIAYTAAIVFSGLNIVGGIKCAQLVAQHHVHFVMAMMSMMCNLVTLACPAIVAVLCPEETPSQWARLFFILSIIVAAFNVPFVFLASSKPAEWTNPDWKKTVVYILPDEKAIKSVY